MASSRASELKAAPCLKRYETLLELAGSVICNRHLPELFRDLLTEVRKFEFLKCRSLRPAQQIMRLNVLEAAISITIPMSFELPVSESPARWVWQHREPLLLRNLC